MSQNVQSILRSIISVIIGYLVLAFTNMAYVIMSYVQPVIKLGPLATIALSVPYNFVFSLAGGYLAGMIAGRSEIKHAAVLAGLMAVVTILSMVIAVAVEPLSYKVTYLLVMLPATVLGGYLRSRRKQT